MSGDKDGLLNRGSPRAAKPSFCKLVLTLASCLWLTRTARAPGYNVHLIPLFFRLFIQGHLLIDGSVESQYITRTNKWGALNTMVIVEENGTSVQILVDTAGVSLPNVFVKCTNQSLLLPTIGKRVEHVVSFATATNLGEGKLWIQTSHRLRNWPCVIFYPWYWVMVNIYAQINS